MTDEGIELGRRAVACKGWRWMPGMLIHYTGLRCFDLPGFPPKLPEPQRARLLGDSPSASLLSGDPFPDLTDPATLGCLLALVREAWGTHANTAANAYEEPGQMWTIYNGKICADDYAQEVAHGATEAEALVATLESAP